MAGIDLRRRDMVVHGSGSVTSTLRSIPSVSSVLNAELSCRPERSGDPSRVGAVRISTGMAPRERRGGHACTIAKWKTGVWP